MPALSDFDIPTLIAQVQSWNHPRGNTKKLLRRYYDSAGQSIEGIQIAQDLKHRILKEIGLFSTQIITRKESADGTVKLLIQVPTENPEARIEKREEKTGSGTVSYPRSEEKTGSGTISYSQSALRNPQSAILSLPTAHPPSNPS